VCGEASGPVSSLVEQQLPNMTLGRGGLQGRKECQSRTGCPATLKERRTDADLDTNTREKVAFDV
jgi:hypothetical protein